VKEIPLLVLMYGYSNSNIDRAFATAEMHITIVLMKRNIKVLRMVLKKILMDDNYLFFFNDITSGISCGNYSRLN